MKIDEYLKNASDEDIEMIIKIRSIADQIGIAVYETTLLSSGYERDGRMSERTKVKKLWRKIADSLLEALLDDKLRDA